MSSSLHSHVTFYLEWCDEIKLSNLPLPRKSGTIKRFQLLSTKSQILNKVYEEVAGRYVETMGRIYLHHIKVVIQFDNQFDD